jgi:hypothetical protein
MVREIDFKKLITNVIILSESSKSSPILSSPFFSGNDHRPDDNAGQKSNSTSSSSGERWIRSITGTSRNGLKLGN